MSDARPSVIGYEKISIHIKMSHVTLTQQEIEYNRIGIEIELDNNPLFYEVILAHATFINITEIY